MKALIGVCLERMAKADNTPADTVPLDSSLLPLAVRGLWIYKEQVYGSSNK